MLDGAMARKWYADNDLWNWIAFGPLIWIRTIESGSRADKLSLIMLLTAW